MTTQVPPKGRGVAEGPADYPRFGGSPAGAVATWLASAWRDAGAILPGLALVAGVAVAARLAALALFPYGLAIHFEVPLAMLFGLVLVNLGYAPDGARPGVQFAVHPILRLGIILLGLRLNLGTIANIGFGAVGLVLAGMTTAILFAMVVGRRFGLPPRLSLLLGVGASVCGNSAIIATAPVVKADEREVSFAVTTTTLFGTLAVFLFPFVGRALEIDVLAFGLWAGTAVSDTAQTIAASATYSTIARDVATVVKLVRNALMAPLLLLIAWAWTRFGDRNVSREAARRGVRKAFPLFILGFLALALLRTLHVIDPDSAASVDEVTRVCFLLALAGLGLNTRLGHLRAVGLRPFLVGLGTTACLAAGMLALIVALGIGPARTQVAGAVDLRAGTGVWTAVCVAGERPALAGAFLGLARQLGDRMGEPTECPTVDPATGDLVQRTTRGAATFRRASGLATFTDGQQRWAIRDAALLQWSEPVADPPASAVTAPLSAVTDAAPAPAARQVTLPGRVLAVGIPGAGALSAVGAFHPGGPVHDKREFAATIRPGRVLDPTRLLVASPSNFGAPLARPDWAPGAILSLATDAPEPLVVPPDLGRPPAP